MTYELQSVNLPTLTGNALRLFVKALETTWSGNMVAPGLLKQAGFETLRQFAAHAAPQFLPSRPIRLPIVARKLTGLSKSLSQSHSSGPVMASSHELSTIITWRIEPRCLVRMLFSTRCFPRSSAPNQNP